MRRTHIFQIMGLALLTTVLVGCSSQPSAPPAPPPAAASEAAQNNPNLNQVLQDPKTTPASANYIKSHMPPGSGPMNGR